MSQALAELKALTTDQPAAPLRPKQIQAYEGELKRLGALRDSLDTDGKPAPWIGAQNADAARQIRRIRARRGLPACPDPYAAPSASAHAKWASIP